jgi:hypothetical protein
MNKLSTLLCFTTFLLVTTLQTGYAQADTAQNSPPPVPVQQNAGFDVIIKINGEILHGLVKEVGPYYIMYKRTDIPDGPVYSIPRNEVYALSYRNQVKEYFNQDDYNMNGGLQPGNTLPYPNINYNYQTFTNGNASIGLGFLRSYSKVKDIKSYSSSSAFPVVLFAYDADFRNSVRLGVQMGFGARNFSTEQFSSYDSTINNIKLKDFQKLD